MRAVAIRSVR